MSSPRRGQARSLLLQLGGAAVVGALAGLAGVACRAAEDQLQRWATGSDESLLDAARALLWWQRLLLPTVGALVAGLLMQIASRGETAYGISDLMEVVTLRRRQIRAIPTLGRIASSLATIASGGSVGREGPIIQLGATVAHFCGRLFRRDPRSHSILLAAGAAAGMAAAYNAPLAGAVFVMEAVLANFALDVFATVGVAAIAGAVVTRTLLGDQPVYAVDEARVAVNGVLLLAALPLGLLCGGAAVLFQRLLQRATAAFAALPVHAILKAGLGGLLVGLLGLWLPEVWGNGFDAASELVHWKLTLPMVALLLVMKPVATAASIGSGGRGGVFTPAMFVGAALGMLLSSAARGLGITTSGEALAFVGMAGLIAGITHAPIMATLLLFELTQRAGLLLPAALCAALSALTAKLLARDSLYTESLRARGVPVDAGIEELTLRQTKVGELLRTDAPTVGPRTPLPEILVRFRNEPLDLLYVVDEGGRFLGVVTLHDVKEFLTRFRDAGAQAVIASDALRKAPTLRAEQSVADVLDLFAAPEFDELAVVSAEPGAGRLLGRVLRRDLIALLDVEVLGRPNLRAKVVIEGGDHPHYLELPRGYELARLPVTAALAGRRLGDTGLRRNHRLVVLAIVRPDPEIGEQRIAFDPDLVLEEGEQLVVMGERAIIESVRNSTKAP